MSEWELVQEWNLSSLEGSAVSPVLNATLEKKSRALEAVSPSLLCVARSHIDLMVWPFTSTPWSYLSNSPLLIQQSAEACSMLPSGVQSVRMGLRLEIQAEGYHWCEGGWHGKAPLNTQFCVGWG